MTRSLNHKLVTINSSSLQSYSATLEAAVDEITTSLQEPVSHRSPNVSVCCFCGLLLITWLNSLKFTVQPAAQLRSSSDISISLSSFCMHPFVRLLLTLHRLKHSLAKTDHPTLSHPSDQLSKVISSNMCVCVCVFVCLCVCVCVCVCVHALTCVCACAHAQTSCQLYPLPHYPEVIFIVFVVWQSVNI